MGNEEIYYIMDSSRIEKVIFSVKDNKFNLRITFKGGKVYDYNSISYIDFKEFRRCIEEGESVGKAFQKYIRNKYAGVRQLEEE